jgi:protoporphyrinogen oxidase
MKRISVSKDKKVIVLGAGPTGLSAAYHLNKSGYEVIVYEKENDYGGLCNSFTIDGFTFDTFAHVSFDNNPDVKELLEGTTEHFLNNPEALNFYKNEWIRNPVQNNLVRLNLPERLEVIKGFINRKERQIQNYDDWLRNMYGDYFTDNFPTKYTRKYWTVEPEQLEPQWVEGRMYTPTIDEVLLGAMSEETPNVHYSKQIRYPKNGGFQAFLTNMTNGLNIQYNKCLDSIDLNKKVAGLTDGSTEKYDDIISTIPLPDLCSSISGIPDEISEEAGKLDYTSGIMVSLGFNKPNISPSLWFYIYDEEIYPARVYAPDRKSINNVPEGCSALQAEIYYSKYKPLVETLDIILDKTIHQLINMKLFREEDLLVKDIRMKKYANIMFTPDIYKARDKIHNYLKGKNIQYAGRFGEWDYLWVGQSIISGMNVAKEIIERRRTKDEGSDIGWRNGVTY